MAKPSICSPAISRYRHEHSIEFQVVFLQYLLGGRRPLKIVPILTGSFHTFVASGRQPREDAGVAAFCQAMRQTTAEHEAKGGRVCYISGGDLAHIGRRFGDRSLLDKDRLDAQTKSDLSLLQAACRADAPGLFAQIAEEKDANRICGLSPTYTMLEVMQPAQWRAIEIRPGGRARRQFLRQLRQRGILRAIARRPSRASSGTAVIARASEEGSGVGKVKTTPSPLAPPSNVVP